MHTHMLQENSFLQIIVSSTACELRLQPAFFRLVFLPRRAAAFWTMSWEKKNHMVSSSLRGQSYANWIGRRGRTRKRIILDSVYLLFMADHNLLSTKGVQHLVTECQTSLLKNLARPGWHAQLTAAVEGRCRQSDRLTWYPSFQHHCWIKDRHSKGSEFRVAIA